MKTRHLSFVSLAAAYLFLTAGTSIVGCGGGGSGGSAGSTGTAGSTGSGGSSAGTSGGGSGGDMPPAENLISDFEDIAAATVVMSGTPPRNGYWYTYNDATPCTQVPAAMDTTMKYIGSAPPTLHDGATGSLALHGSWSGCTVWGAGIGADLNQPAAADGGTYSGPKVPYDVTAYAGVTFWASAATTSDTAFRIKFPMTDETKTTDGGDCVDTADHKCSDDWGEQFNLPTTGAWKQITIKWADTGFHTEGWGAQYTWNPQHVTSIQIQSVNKGETYDFWIDDLYFISN